MFVALCPAISVDPTEVTLVAAHKSGTRVYLRGGGRSWLTVERPFDEVTAILEAANQQASEVAP